MRIMVAAPEYGRQWGGVGTYLSELIRGLAPRHEFVILSGGPAAPVPGVTVVPLVGPGPIMSSYARFQVALRRHMARLVQEHRPDLFVVHHAQMSDLITASPSCPLIVTAHTTVLGQARGALAALRGGSPLDSSERTTLAALPVLVPAEMLYWRRVHHALFVSNAVRREVEGAYSRPPGTAATVLNGLSLSALNTGGGPTRSAEPEGPLVFCNGRLLGLKGISVLLRSMKLWRHERARLVVTGGGDRDAWEQHARGIGVPSGRVTFRGSVPHDVALQILRDADVFVMPSYNESCPYSLIEAMAAGKPIVASVVGGIPEMVRDGESALLVPPGDPAALAAAVDRLLDDGALGRRLGAAAEERARSMFTAERMCTDTVRYFESVLASG